MTTLSYQSPTVGHSDAENSLSYMDLLLETMHEQPMQSLPSPKVSRADTERIRVLSRRRGFLSTYWNLYSQTELEQT